MEQQQVPKLATRIYSKKPLGAYPEVDQSILHNPSATKPEERYLVLGEKFAGSLAAARALASDMLKVANRNTITEVEYEPATGWHYKYPQRRTKSDEGKIMTQANATPATEVQPTGKWLMALTELTNWMEANAKPDDTDPVNLNAWNTKHKQMQDRVSYHKGVVLGSKKPRGAKPKAAKPNKTTTLGAELGKEKPQPSSKKERVFAAAAKFVANISVGGIKMQCDTIEDLDRAVTMIKAMSKPAK